MFTGPVPTVVNPEIGMFRTLHYCLETVYIGITIKSVTARLFITGFS
jgi:hypothetical protein